jgi:hypothetical protein
MQLKTGFVLAAIASAVNANAAALAERAPTAAQLIQAEITASSHCQGSTDPTDVNVQMECDRRSRIVGRLSQLGWCYGKKGQVGGDYRWHQCATGSNVINDLKEGPQP